MTAEPLEPPPEWLRVLLTVDEYLALGETEFRTELVEGLVTLSARPMPRHQKASLRLASAMLTALPAGYEVLQEIDVNLELAPAGAPGFVRSPDLVVARAEAVRDVDEHGGAVRACDVLLVVEIVSPGSVRTDRVTKRNEYADADIPHYWIVDLDAPVSILTYHRAGELGYADGGEVTGTFRTDQPFGFELELDRLR
jgi:Uma2 family endonuclease